MRLPTSDPFFDSKISHAPKHFTPPSDCRYSLPAQDAPDRPAPLPAPAVDAAPPAPGALEEERRPATMSRTQGALLRQWEGDAGPSGHEGMLNAAVAGALNAIEAHLSNDSADEDEIPTLPARISASAQQWINLLASLPPAGIGNHDNPMHPPLANSGAALEASSSSQHAGAGEGRAIEHHLRKRLRPAEEEQALKKQRLEQEAYVAGWNAWAQAGGASGEDRLEAVNRMTAWLVANDPEQELDLRSLGLTSLPESLPASLELLNVMGNRLTSLPENLPASLQILDANDNRLTSLPESLPASLELLNVQDILLTRLPESLPASLEILDVDDNQLTGLPANLPASIENLHVARNRLTSLPESLPASLEILNVLGNRLTSLPEHILTTLGSGCDVILSNNPLSDRVRNHLDAAANAADYNGPTVSFSMANASDTMPVRPLLDAVSAWHGEDNETVNAIWSALPNDKEAEAFSKFLDRLGGTVNSGNPQFRHGVAAWLSHLADHPQLRNDTFLLAFGATDSCEDRVSLTFNDMKKARLSADVENGRYDDRLPDLVPLARGMFRLDRLEEIAREKVKSLRFVDEIEVYLAYQVKLRETLHLPLDTPDMRFFDVSYVTPADLAQAETEVKASENQEFIPYLSTGWQPWQAVLKRLHATGYAEAQDKLIDAMGDEFSTRLNAYLKGSGMENDDDAQRIAGAHVLAEIKHEINGRLTMDFLKTKELAHLLAPQWGDQEAPAEGDESGLPVSQ